MHPFPNGLFSQVSLTALRRCNEIREEAGLKPLRVNGGDMQSIGDAVMITFSGTDESWIETKSHDREGRLVTESERHQEDVAHFIAKPAPGGFTLQPIDADAKPIGDLETYGWTSSTVEGPS